MIPRTLATDIDELLAGFPVVSITGPRQSGKTTLARELHPEFQYVSLEDTDTRHLAKDDPRLFFTMYPKHTIIDEAQRVPELFSYLQGIVDAANEPGQFILTGSQNFLLLKSISQSLAGRVGLTYLLPLTYSEILKAGLQPDDLDEWLLRGGYPRLYSSRLSPNRFFDTYVSTYVERDVRGELGVRKLADFRRFLGLCAYRIGELTSDSSLATDARISTNTSGDWMSILEASFVTFRLQPYYRNFGKRLTKTPKLYFYDSGLAAHLLGLESVDDLRSNNAFRGHLFENMVVSEIVKEYYSRGKTPHVYYWRDSNQKEADLIIEKAGRIRYLVEIKASSTYDPHAFATLDSLGELMGCDASQKVLVYGGDDSFMTRHGRVIGVRQLHELVE